MRKTSVALMLATALVSQIALAESNVATVNGVAIPQSRMDWVLKEWEAKEVGQNGNIDDKAKAQLKEILITNEVIRQEAFKKHFDKDPTYLAQVDQMKEQLLVRTFINDFVKKHPIADATAKKEYDKIKVNMGSKEYRVRHILVEDEGKAKDLIAQLKKGAKFDVLAKENSKDAGSAKQGGELGWAVPDNYTLAFAEAIKKMPKGKITDAPVKTEFGWHVIKVEDIRTSKGPAFTEVKQEVIRQMQGEALKKHIAELVAKAKITQ
jgi:peptidyl-prolyl cis-trans isomerase C